MESASTRDPDKKSSFCFKKTTNSWCCRGAFLSTLPWTCSRIWQTSNHFWFLPNNCSSHKNEYGRFLLFIIIAIFRRSYLYIFSVGLLGCILAGTLKRLRITPLLSGFRSIKCQCRTAALFTISLICCFLALLDNQPPTRLTLIRIVIAIFAVILLTQGLAEMWISSVCC